MSNPGDIPQDKKDNYIQCPQCNSWHWVRANDPPREFCLECLSALEQAARRRPPTEHPADGEKVLALTNLCEWPSIVQWSNLYSEFMGEDEYEKLYPVTVKGWWPIKHLVGEDGE